MSLWQTFANQAREIRIIIGGAGACIDQAAVFEFGERKSPGSNCVILIKQFVGFSVKKNAPIPSYAEFGRALCADTCGAVLCNRVVPPRILVECVECTYVFAKSLARLLGRSQRVVKINILPSVVRA